MKRRFQAYCVGTGRSGTRSIAGIFASCYHTAHEPNFKELLAIIPSLQKGLITQQAFKDYVIHLDNKRQLEFNSSFLNTWLLDVLVPEFLNAKFIFTIRDCYSWLNSAIIDSFLRKSKLPVREYEKFLDVMIGPGIYRFLQDEKAFFENKEFVVDKLLYHWADVNERIFNTVPKSRMLVVKTYEISSRIDAIADFINIPSENLDPGNSYVGKSIQYPNILSKIDRNFLASKVNLHCKALMDKFFPGFLYTFE